MSELNILEISHIKSPFMRLRIFLFTWVYVCNPNKIKALQNNVYSYFDFVSHSNKVKKEPKFGRASTGVMILYKTLFSIVNILMVTTYMELLVLV